jgi:hypothetical protein
MTSDLPVGQAIWSGACVPGPSIRYNNSLVHCHRNSLLREMSSSCPAEVGRLVGGPRRSLAFASIYPVCTSSPLSLGSLKSIDVVKLGFRETPGPRSIYISSFGCGPLSRLGRMRPRYLSQIENSQ